MASHRNFSQSIEDGSDALFDFECTPCNADGTVLEATHFCQICNKYLCKTCTKYHQRLTKSHKLVTAESTKQTGSKNDIKCHLHTHCDVDMYCGTHDVVYCKQCISMEHKSCRNVEEVKDGIHKPNVSGVQQLVADIDRVTDELRDTKQDKTKNLALTKTKKADLLKEIDKSRKEMKEHLDQLESKMKKELDDEISKLEQEMRDDVAAADNLLTIVGKRKPDLASNNNDKHLFIAEKLGRKVVFDSNSFLMKANSSERNTLKFERNPSLYNGIKKAGRMGRFVRYGAHVVKSSDSVNVKTQNDRVPCFILAMCQLQDGTILLIDRNNKRLKRLDYQLNVKDFCEMKSDLFGLCTVSSTEVAVEFKDSIQFVQVSDKMTPGKKIKINVQKFCSSNSVTFCNDQFWTFAGKSLSIYVYSPSGALIKTIDRDAQGQKVFPMYCPAGIAVSNDETRIYVTDGTNRLVVYSSNGDFMYDLRDQRLTATAGVCVSDGDIALVAGYASKNVVMFDKDGNNLGELVTSKDMLSGPRSLHYDRKKRRLIVGYETDIIQEFDLSE